MCQEDKSVHDVQRERRKIRIRYATNIGAICLLFPPEVRIRKGIPSPWRCRSNLFEISFGSVGWLRKCHREMSHRDRFGTNETSRQEVRNDGNRIRRRRLSSTIDATTGRRHRAIERTHLLGCIGDDAGNGHSMLKWKIRARAGRFRQRQSREKMAEAEMPVTCLLKFSEMLCQIPSRPGRKHLLWVVISKAFVLSKTRHRGDDAVIDGCSLFFLGGLDS